MEEEEAIPIQPEIASARSVFIKSNVDKIHTMKAEGKTKDEIQEVCEGFAKEYPTLFKMMFSDSYNMGSLKTMITMLEKMGTGEMTQHQASVVVGQRLHDVYIKPRIPNMERKE
jgi:hypothetical protein